MGNLLRSLYQFVWETDPGSRRPRRAAVRVLRLLHVLGREVVWEGRIPDQATSLVYTTLLALVPLLAVGFSVLKGFGLHTEVYPLLAGAFEPLGEAGTRMAERLMGFVEDVNVGVLGAVGVVFLLYTAISLAQKIEDALNELWAVRRLRGYVQRIVGYLSIITVGPLLAVGSLALSASVLGSERVQALIAIGPLGAVITFFLTILPYLLVILAFTFVYLIIPNARVEVKAAFIGGLVAGVLWETVGWIFGAMAVGSTRYSAVYSSLAILVVFMIWVFQSWLILLFGARLAFYVQHPESLRRSGSTRISARLAERLALLMMARIVRDYLQGERLPWTSDQLAEWMEVPVQVVERIAEDLRKAGLLLATGGEPPGLVPGRSPERIPMRELMEAVRSAGGNEVVPPYRLPEDALVDRYMNACEQACEETLGRTTVVDLAGGPAAT
ncbi:YhjD/YihY/BrkB family envelope integrity protein [Thiohalorhabdus sp. Cl-TMA]|uniref:YhjD/YihY/BrkB family envelope integrity protein n=1 Tax=Thiohalorhabdus methylotrophus TaxID=3242694 RepID=A0ABV4TY32_9GAMM